MLYLDHAKFAGLGSPAELVEALAGAFVGGYSAPPRTHHRLPHGDAALLLMPAWRVDGPMGVKVATVSPHNGAQGIPTVQGVYVLFDGNTGAPTAFVDAAALTRHRTAAVSALGSSRLARPDASTLLMVGTGALAPHLVRAHLAVRPLERVLIWGRSGERAAACAESLADLPLEVELAGALDDAVAEADIISCATLSLTPLVCGRAVRPGTHVDLVGSFTAEMREADDALMSAAQIFVDTRHALCESGDLIAPMAAGLIGEDDVVDLGELLAHPHKGRSSEAAITVFKTVGTALSDLAAAEYFVSRFERQRDQSKRSIAKTSMGMGVG